MKRFFTRFMCFTLAFSMLLSSASAISPVRPASGEPDPTVVRSAVETFRKLSKKEKNNRFKQVKKAIKNFKDANAGKSAAAEINQLLLILITILLPPLGVYLHQGEINTKFWISLVLTLLFYFPGLIYSLIVILGSPSGSSN